MSKIANTPLAAPAGDDPRRTFDSAIAQMQEQGERPLSQRPIFSRKLAAKRGDPATEKALTDAARALARLWKLSPASVR